MADSNPMEEKFAGGTCMYAYVRVGAGSFPVGGLGRQLHLFGRKRGRVENQERDGNHREVVIS